MTADGHRRPVTTFVKLLILLSTVNIVYSTYLISVSDDQMTNQSESVILSCKAYNNLTAQELTVAWRRSGIVITERKLVNIENLKQFINEDELYRYTIQGLPVSLGVTDFRLGIKDLKKEDIGNYACSLCKRSSFSFSCIEPLQIEENLPVSLDVMYTPTEKYPECSILKQTSLGSEITVECVSEKGKPHVDLKLTIDGEILHNPLATELLSEEDGGLLRIAHSFTVTESNIGKEIGCNSTSPYFKDYTGRCANGIIIVEDIPDISLISTPAESVSVRERVSFTYSTANLETTETNPGDLTEVGLLHNADGSNTVLIVGMILAVMVLIVLGGIAGYLLFVRRKTNKGHKPVPLNETSTTIMADNTWNESNTGDEFPDKCKTATETAFNGFTVCEQDKDVKLPKLTPEVQEYSHGDGSNNLDDDDVFMNVTQTLPIPTHV